MNRGQIILARATIPARLQERHQIFELVVHAAWGLVLLITQKSRELQQILPLYFFEVEFVAGFHEVRECCRVRRQGFRLLRELGFVEKIRDCGRYRSVAGSVRFQAQQMNTIVHRAQFSFFCAGVARWLSAGSLPTERRTRFAPLSPFQGNTHLPGVALLSHLSERMSGLTRPFADSATGQ